MVDRDIVLAKIAAIRRCLDRIQEVTGGNPDCLDRPDQQDLFVLNLQRAVQAAIDLAAHMVADASLGLPATLKENFALLAAAGSLPVDLRRRLQGMVGFRNIAVHDYQALDVAILKAILTERLADLDAFCDEAADRLGDRKGD